MAGSTGGRRLAGAVGLVLAAFVATGCRSGSSTTSVTSLPADQDVTVSSCGLSDDQAEGYLAKLAVTNHEVLANDYVVTITFVGPDGAQELDRVAVAITKVDPAKTVEEEALSKPDLRSTAGVTCKMASALRSVAG